MSEGFTPRSTSRPSQLSCLDLSGLRRASGKQKALVLVDCKATPKKRNCGAVEKSKATQGGVTARPNPSGRKERSSRNPKGRRSGGKHLGFAECVLLRGKRRNQDLGQFEKPNATRPQKGREASGAATDAPSLSRQRVGDTEMHGRDRGGELAQCVSPSSHFCWPGSVSEFFAQVKGSMWPASLAAAKHL